jgi:cell division protein FtsW
MKKLGIVEKLNNQRKGSLDFGMLISIFILLCMGIVMLSSASSYYGLSNYSNSNFYLTKQLEFGIVGFIAMIIISKIDYNIYKKWGFLIYGFGILLMIAVLIPGIGESRNGATRWIAIGTNTFQPSELMKIALVIGISTYLALNYKKLNKFKGYYVPLIMLGLVMIIMFFQNHLSGTLVMIIAAVSIIFASGIKIKVKHIVPILIISSIALGGFIFAERFRLQRIISFMNIEEDITGGNWQSAQSLYAVGSGGLFGRGLGQSRQKYLWLPEAQNDFIFAVVGEELGLVGTVTVIAIFSFFIYRGFKIAITAKDLYGSLLATGITSVFALQIIVNVAVVTCLIPVTGMPLPFFSYGGTALFINLCTMGILLNVSRSCKN